jgi:hypothetical protein
VGFPSAAPGGSKRASLRTRGQTKRRGHRRVHTSSTRLAVRVAIVNECRFALRGPEGEPFPEIAGAVVTVVPDPVITINEVCTGGPLCPTTIRSHSHTVSCRENHSSTSFDTSGFWRAA